MRGGNPSSSDRLYEALEDRLIGSTNFLVLQDLERVVMEIQEDSSSILKKIQEELRVRGPLSHVDPWDFKEDKDLSSYTLAERSKWETTGCILIGIWQCTWFIMRI